MKIKAIAPYFIYLLINSIFIIKYTSRLNFFNEFLFALIYLVIIILIIYSYIKINIYWYYYKYIFFIMGVTLFVFTIYLNININGNNLNVDRWSAMEVGIKALLNGQYPYSAIDHLRGRTSNLPSLIFIGIPFYLMGNIGYLQSFAFLIFSLIMYIAFNNYRDRLFCMLLLTLSPSYLWEVYVKSDLMSNFIFILFFLIVVQNKIIKDKKINPIILPFISTALVLTRLTVIIPISLLLFNTNPPAASIKWNGEKKYFIKKSASSWIIQISVELEPLMYSMVFNISSSVFVVIKLTFFIAAIDSREISFC